MVDEHTHLSLSSLLSLPSSSSFSLYVSPPATLNQLSSMADPKFHGEVTGENVLYFLLKMKLGKQLTSG